MKTKKKFWGTIVLTIAMFVSVGCAKASNSTKSSSSSSAKSEKIDLQKDFYQGEKFIVASRGVVVTGGDIDNFLNQSQIFVVGKVEHLANGSNESSPSTIATVKINKIIKGKKVKKNQSIKVLFEGGNATGRDLLSTYIYTVKTDIKVPNDSTIVTVETDNNYLPIVGDEFAMGLVKYKNENYWYSPVAGDGIFKKIGNQFVVKGKIDGSGNKINDASTENNSKINSEINKLLTSK